MCLGVVWLVGFVTSFVWGGWFVDGCLVGLCGMLLFGLVGCCTSVALIVRFGVVV